MTPADLATYDRIVLAFSGGKDSVAALLHLLDLGVDLNKVELHHHEVDGGGPDFMDWSVTPAYCRAFAQAFGLPLYTSYKVGGFAREMDRDNTGTAPIYWEGPNGAHGHRGGDSGKVGTRLVFPQVSPSLAVRWCSAYLKIDVMDSVIRADPRFLEGRTLVITGERAQESANRAAYKTFEPHRADSRDGSRVRRYIDHWRPVHAWTESQVWDALRRWGVVPHVAYQLGWGRLSCLSCIFGSPNQWATIRAIFPDRFEIIRAREERTGKTIQRKRDVTGLADAGRPYAAALDRPDLVALASGHTWTGPIRVDPAAWVMPAGAFGESAGPT